MNTTLSVPTSLHRVITKADRFARVVGVPDDIARALFIKYYKVDKSNDEDIISFTNCYRDEMKEVCDYD
jgi:hypothetical protein